MSKNKKLYRKKVNKLDTIDKSILKSTKSKHKIPHDIKTKMQYTINRLFLNEY